MGPFVHALLRWYSLRHLSAVIPLNNGPIGILNAYGGPDIAGTTGADCKAVSGTRLFCAYGPDVPEGQLYFY